MMVNALALFSSGRDHNMGPYPYAQRPQWAIVREIDFKVDTTADGDELVFYYSRHQRIRRLGSDADFEQLLRDVASPSWTGTGGDAQTPPVRTRLSLNSRNRLSYVVLRLSPDRWQFPRLGPPVKIGAEGYSEACYYEARRVDSNGVPDDGSIEKDHCRVCYFISDGEKAKSLEPFAHLFNIYVELHVGGSQPMPIRIDPDVRHPGGSGGAEP